MIIYTHNQLTNIAKSQGKSALFTILEAAGGQNFNDKITAAGLVTLILDVQTSAMEQTEEIEVDALWMPDGESINEITVREPELIDGEETPEEMAHYEAIRSTGSTLDWMYAEELAMMDGNTSALDAMIEREADKLVEEVLAKMDPASRAHYEAIQVEAEEVEPKTTNGLTTKEYWQIRDTLGFTPRKAAEMVAFAFQWADKEVTIERMNTAFCNTSPILNEADREAWKLCKVWWMSVTDRIRKSVIKAGVAQAESKR